MTGTLPEIWLQAIVIPIPKVVNSTSPGDYRPISIICPSLKILEKAIYERLLIHFNRFGIIPSCQHGFRQNKSVTTQLLETFEDYTKAIEKGHWVDVIFFDFKKAFDSVPHSRLIAKLESVGISGALLEWIKSYLSNRSFQVIVDGELSESIPAKSGVPQGSTLGPLFFLLFLHDLPSYCNTTGVTIKLFADDLKAYHAFDPQNLLLSNFTKPLNNFISKLQDYCMWNGLSINIKKCISLHLGNRNPELSYYLNGDLIPSAEPSSSIRDLGIQFTNDLKWDKHIATITLKSRKVAFSILRSIKCKNPSTLVQLFTTYVRPILEFSSSLFSPYVKKNIAAIEKVQKEYLTIVYKRTNFGKSPSSYENLLFEYNISSLEKRRLKADLLLFHKYMTGIIDLPPDFQAFRFNPTITRGEVYKINIPTVTHPSRFNSYFIRVANHYRKLPTEIRSLNYKGFYNKIESHIWVSCYLVNHNIRNIHGADMRMSLLTGTTSLNRATGTFGGRQRFQ